MNYKELMVFLREAFLCHPFVGHFYTDVWEQDADKGNVCYPCVIVTVNSTDVGPQATTTSLNIMYVDRMTPEKDNVLDVQSLGQTIIKEMLNALEYQSDLDMPESIRFMTFRDRFADNCAGTYATIEIETLSDIGECAYICLK